MAILIAFILFRPHMGRGRYLCSGQLIHSSLLHVDGNQEHKASLKHIKLQASYTTWEDILHRLPHDMWKEKSDFVELDFLERSLRFVKQVQSAKPESISDLLKEYRSLTNFGMF